MRRKREDVVKRRFAAILVVMAAFSLNSFVLAVVANPDPYDVIQADGQQIKVVRMGDEWNNWIETMEGYAIEKDSHGWWVYVGTSHIKEGGLVVGVDNPTGLVEKHFKAVTQEVPYSARYHGCVSQITLPANQRVLVILVEFSNQSSMGTTPVHMCAWSKDFSGFVNPITAVYRRTNFFTEVSTSPDIYIVPTLAPNEYFMVENRQLSGYDAGLWVFLQTTQGGLAIWHIDMTKLWNGNNNNANNKLVDLEEAEGNCELDCLVNFGDRQDLFYQGNKDTFTDSTVPNSNLYNGTSTNISITSISTSQPTMSAFFSGLDIQLQASRGTERAFIIQRDYGNLIITIDNKVQMPVANYIVLRQEGNQQVQVGTIPSSNIQNGVPYTYIDKYLDKGKTYKYMIEAHLSDGSLIAVSNDSSSI